MTAQEAIAGLRRHEPWLWERAVEIADLIERLDKALAVAVEWIELKGGTPIAGPWAQRALAAIKQAKEQ